jgi:GPH family glycoside/pentoside/hexuronide:cation symporter
MKFTRKLTYSLGKLADTISYQSFTNRIQFFYIDVLGINAGLVSIVWFLFGFWNAVDDPLMGQLTDRTRSRWGRRIPYLLFGAVPLGLLFFLLWTPPTGGRNTALTLIYFTIVLFLFDTLSSLLLMSYNALFPEIAGNTKERSHLAAFRETISLFGLILAFVLSPILSTRLGYPSMGLVIGAITAFGFMICVRKLKENPQRQGETQLGFIESIKITFKNKPFRWFIGAALSREFNFIILSATIPFWRKYVLNIQNPSSVFGINMGPDIQEAILLAVPFLVAIPGMQIWRWITPRIGPRKSWICANLSWIPGLIIMFLSNNIYMALIGVALVGPGLAGFMMLYIIQLSEITDYDAKVTGQYREGTYLGIAGLLMRLAFSVQAVLFAVLLAPSGYVPDLAQQPEAAVNAIRFLTAGAPMIAALTGATCLYFLRVPSAAKKDAPEPIEVVSEQFAN